MNPPKQTNYSLERPQLKRYFRVAKYAPDESATSDKNNRLFEFFISSYEH